MKIDVTSDWHLNWFDDDRLRQECYSTLVDKCSGKNDSEVLFICGDICDNLEGALTKQDNIQNQFITDVLVDVCGQYQDVYLVLGNHDYWHNTISTEERLKKIIPVLLGSHVHLLSFNETIPLTDNIDLIGGTYWTNLNPEEQLTAMVGMNDYRYIKNFFPLNSSETHEKNKEFIREKLKNKDRRYVILTHHCPSNRGITEEYRGSSLNPCFSNNDDDLFTENDNILFWCYGHSHSQKITRVTDNTTLVNNSADYRFDTSYRFKKIVV